MLPMGTIMAACMLIGALGLAVLTKLPRSAAIALSLLLAAAGLWNTLWYGLRHFTDFWGAMAWSSGLVMLFASIACFRFTQSGLTQNSKWHFPILALLLAGFGSYYAWTIYNL